MIDVGMTEDDRADRRDVEGECFAIPLVALAAALDHAAVEQQTSRPGINEVT